MSNERSMHSRSFPCIFFMIIVIFAFLLFFTENVQASGIHPIELKDGWQYRTGESPVGKDGIPVWASDDETDPGWRDFKYTGKPIENKGEKNVVWFRIKAPENHQETPTLYLNRIYSKSLAVYYNGKLVAQHENLNPPFKSPIYTLTGHVIPLGPNYYAGKFITLKVFTDLKLTGFYGNTLIGSYNQILKLYIKKDFGFIILGFFFMIFGVFGLSNIIFLQGSIRKSFISLSFFVMSLSIFFISECDIVGIILLDNIHLWTFLNLISMFLAPTLLMYFLEQIFGSGYKSIVRILWKVHMLYVAAYLIIYFLTTFKIFSGIYSIDLLINTFYFLVMIDLLIQIPIVVRNAFKGNTDAKIFTGGFVIFASLCIYELIMYKVASIVPFMSQWGILILIGSLVLIMGRRFSVMHNQVVVYSKELEAKNKTLNLMWTEVNESRNRIAEWNETLEQIVAARTASIKSLLDNAGQGFLTFGKDFLINEEYSLECNKIFNEPIANKKFSELIHEDEKEKEILETLLDKIINEESRAKQDLLVSLIHSEVKIGDKHIRVEYKIIHPVKKDTSVNFMVILTDVTEKRNLENRMEEERKLLKMVVNAVTRFNEFSGYIKKYRYFCETGLNNILTSSQPLDEIIFEIFRSIHTFKGNFGQVHMVSIVKQLHELETHLSEMRENIRGVTLEELKLYASGSITMSLLNEDLQKLKDILGEHFFNHEKTIFVDQTKLKEIEQKIINTLPEKEASLLLPDFRRLWFRPFKELLKTYPDYVQKLSDFLKKPMNPMVIQGGNMLVDLEKYSDLSRSLVHVFKNAVDHGIEPTEERKLKGKSKAANISCQITKQDHFITISISDDGKGLNIDHIRDQAIKNGIIPGNDGGLLNQDQILELITMDGFSTSISITDISGRGIGLAAVKSEVDKLDGVIEVHSTQGMGTEIRISIPVDEMYE